jgi:hypothetical protein
MDESMSYAEMLANVFQQPGAYPYPFGSDSLGTLSEMSDAELQRRPWARLRDQAVAVDAVFAEYKGRYLALHAIMQREGAHVDLSEDLARVCQSLRRIQAQQRRLRALLEASPQPRRGVERN